MCSRAVTISDLYLTIIVGEKMPESKSTKKKLNAIGRLTEIALEPYFLFFFFDGIKTI